MTQFGLRVFAIVKNGSVPGKRKHSEIDMTFCDTPYLRLSMQEDEAVSRSSTEIEAMWDNHEAKAAEQFDMIGFKRPNWIKAYYRELMSGDCELLEAA